MTSVIQSLTSMGWNCSTFYYDWRLRMLKSLLVNHCVQSWNRSTIPWADHSWLLTQPPLTDLFSLDQGSQGMWTLLKQTDHFIYFWVCIACGLRIRECGDFGIRFEFAADSCVLTELTSSWSCSGLVSERSTLIMSRNFQRRMDGFW